MCGGIGPYGPGYEGTTHHLDAISNLRIDGRPITSDQKEFGKHQAGDRQMFFFPIDALGRIAQAKDQGQLDAHGNKVIQPSMAPAPGANKPKGRRRTGTSLSGFKGTDKRGDLVGGRKEPSGKKTLLGG